jgi:hypothetical protein
MLRKYAVVMFILVLVVGALIVFSRPWAITRATYNKIRLGMSLAEVQSAIGLPPGDYYVGPKGPGGFARGPNIMNVLEDGLPRKDIPGSFADYVKAKRQNDVLVTWCGNRKIIWVALDKDGKVIGRYLADVESVFEPSVAQSMQMWFGR